MSKIQEKDISATSIYRLFEQLSNEVDSVIQNMPQRTYMRFGYPFEDNLINAQTHYERAYNYGKDNNLNEKIENMDKCCHYINNLEVLLRKWYKKEGDRTNIVSSKKISSLNLIVGKIMCSASSFYSSLLNKQKESIN